jgi:hypothetical protein
VQLIDGRPVFAATDLVGFLYCAHLTNLERARLAGLVHRPAIDEEDPKLQLIRKRRFAHGRRCSAPVCGPIPLGIRSVV